MFCTRLFGIRYPSCTVSPLSKTFLVTSWCKITFKMLHSGSVNQRYSKKLGRRLTPQTVLYNSIRNPKSKTVLIFYSQKTINTLVKSQYISIHLVSFSRVKWQWITSILLLQNITIAQTYQISIHVDYMFSTCWYTLGTNTFSTCCNNPKKY